MSWNFETENYIVRLPISDQDGDALYQLLSQQAVVDHIPRMAMTVDAQALDELRRVAMRFEGREAAFWLIEGKNSGKLQARIGIQYINWMMLNAQLQLELSPEFPLDGLKEVLTEIKNYLFNELHLHRLETRIRTGISGLPEKLLALGFEKEGTLPSQFEYEGEDVSLDIYSIISA